MVYIQVNKTGGLQESPFPLQGLNSTFQRGAFLGICLRLQFPPLFLQERLRVSVSIVKDSPKGYKGEINSLSFCPGGVVLFSETPDFVCNFVEVSQVGESPGLGVSPIDIQEVSPGDILPDILQGEVSLWEGVTYRG